MIRSFGQPGIAEIQRKKLRLTRTKKTHRIGFFSQVKLYPRILIPRCSKNVLNDEPHSGFVADPH